MPYYSTSKRWAEFHNASTPTGDPVKNQKITCTFHNAYGPYTVEAVVESKRKFGDEYLYLVRFSPSNAQYMTKASIEKFSGVTITW